MIDWQKWNETYARQKVDILKTLLMYNKGANLEWFMEYLRWKWQIGCGDPILEFEDRGIIWMDFGRITLTSYGFKYAVENIKDMERQGIKL